MTDRINAIASKINDYDIYPEPIHVEYDPFDLALPEPKRISKRLREYILAQEVHIEDWQILVGQFRFDGSVESDLFHRTGHKNFGEACSAFYCKAIDNLTIFEWQHSTPDYHKVIRRGIKGLLEDIKTSKHLHRNDSEKLIYLDALEETAHTVIAWAHKCAAACLEKAENESNAKRKEELLRAHKTLLKVPEFPAESFYEAVQTIYLCFEFLPDSVGTIDRYLNALYEKDIKEGVLTREEAREILQGLFIRLQSHTPLNTQNRKRGGECHFAIGGYLPTGEDGFTDLSKLIVESIMELPMHCPQITLRWTNKTPKEVLRFVLDYERNDIYKRIAFVNDEPRIKAFMDYLGLSYDQAVNYTMVGCNEPAFQGIVWFGGSTTNIARSIEKTLYDNKSKAIACKTFEEFYSLYDSILENDIDLNIHYSNLFNSMRAKDINVASALFLNGCIESATSPTRGGCNIKLGGGELMGITCVIDSLSIIKQFVYDEKICTMEHLIDVLESNWEKDPDLKQLIYKKGKFFGNNYTLSDDMAVRFTDSLYKHTKDKRLANGERIVYGTLSGYHAHYATFGKLTKATPDARFAGEPFMVGLGQTNGKDREGLSALLSSVAKAQPSGILSGPYLVNVMIDETLIRKDEYFEKIVDQIITFFKMGGMHIQLNYVSKETLLEARKNPKNYNTMKVRVSGFSGIFVDLNEDIQNNVIERTSKGRL